MTRIESNILAEFYSSPLLLRYLSLKIVIVGWSDNTHNGIGLLSFQLKMDSTVLSD